MNADEKKEKRLTPDGFLESLIGKGVTLALMDGKALQGKLVGRDPYNLLISGSDERVILVPKHATKSVYGSP